MEASGNDILKLLKQSKQQPVLTIAELFVKDLEESIEEIHFTEKRPSSIAYKPSSMLCVRNMFYKMVKPNVIKKDKASSIGICESGTDRHERIQQAIMDMKKTGKDCEFIDVETFIKSRKIPNLTIVSKTKYETKLKHTKLNISFLCDGIIKYRGEYYILEIKTESSIKYNKRTDINDLHITQGIAYCYCFGLNKVLYLYENRDNCSKKGYVLTVSEEMKEKFVVNKIKLCDKHLKLGTLPNKPKNLSPDVCKYCDYIKYCNKDEI